MSNLVEHAKVELDKAGFLDKTNDFYGGETGNAVLELIEKFSEQGHSGMSAGIVAGLFARLAKYDVISPITGEDDEWNDISEEMGQILHQNKRCSSLFKRADNKVSYSDAIIFRGEDSWDTFTPKTFYLDVYRELYNQETHGTEEDVRIVGCSDGNYVYFIKDKTQLEEIFNYYDKK
jgi:hypothetical protein